MTGMRAGQRDAAAGPEQPYGDLVGHLSRTTVLRPAEAARVVADVLGYFGEPAEVYVRRRHGELKARGLTNDQAFQRIAQELTERLVAPPHFSQRQLRRIVYS